MSTELQQAILDFSRAAQNIPAVKVYEIMDAIARRGLENEAVNVLCTILDEVKG